MKNGLIMKRIAIMVFSVYCIFTLILLILIFYPICSIIYLIGSKRHHVIFKNFKYIAKLIFKIWYFMCGIEHKEFYANGSLNNNYKQFIFISNHKSYLDIPPLLLLSQSHVKILGKSDGLKFPLFFFIYKHIAISFNRTSLKEKTFALKDVIKYMQLGYHIFIFPEGMFDENPHALKPFHNGAFDIAIKYNLPIQPLYFPNSHHRLNPSSIFSFTPGLNKVQFLPTISVHLENPMTSNELKQYCFHFYNNILISS